MEKKVYIFGAHSRAQTLAEYLCFLDSNISIRSYLYDNDEGNPLMIKGVPVEKIAPASDIQVDYPVYIATRGIYHNQIIEKLKKIGFHKIYPVTVDLDLKLRNKFMEGYFFETGREFIKIDALESAAENKTVALYVVRSVHDKPLQQEYALTSYEKIIQAGAALTQKRFSDNGITDDTNDNISEKNRQFCELTALYWIWKNAEEDIIGLEHYRRHFILPQNWLERMLQNGVDGILPIPLYVVPSLEVNFKKRHDSTDWDYMMEYLKKSSRQEYFEAKQFFEKNLYSPCNMFILRREVLNKLCEWLFPILFAVAENGGEKEDSYLNRYPGFLSERLITFFFEKHRDAYKIVYSDKNFLY